MINSGFSEYGLAIWAKSILFATILLVFLMGCKNDMQPIDPETRTMHFFSGDSASAVSIESDGVRVILTTISEGKKESATRYPASEEWKSFWRKVEIIGIWNLKSSYTQEETEKRVFFSGGGGLWKISLSNKGKFLESEGVRAFPSDDSFLESTADIDRATRWSEFVTALEVLAID